MTSQLDSELTQDIVRELLDYDPLTGAFIWKKRRIEWFASYRSQCSWNAKFAGKAAFTCKRLMRSGVTYLWSAVNWEYHPAHTIAFLWMTGRWPIYEVDHRDGNGTNNRWSNLRDVDHGENMKNCRRVHSHKGNPLRFDHVGLRKQSNGRIEARLTVNNKYVYLGTFDTVEEAIVARIAGQRRFGFTDRHGAA